MVQKIKQDISLGSNIRVSELIALAESFHVDFNAFFLNLQNKNTQQ